MDKKAKTNKSTNNKNQNKTIHKKAVSILSNKKKVTTTTKTNQKEKEKVNDTKPLGTNVSKQNNNNNNNIENEVHSPHTKHVMFNEKVLNPNEHVLDVFCKIGNPFQKGVHKMKKCIKIHMNFQNDENMNDNDLNTPENDIELFNDDNHKHLEKEILKLNEHYDDEFEIDHTFSDESNSLTTKDNKNTNTNGINNKNITKKTILKNKNFNSNNDNKRKTSAKKLVAKDSFRKSSNTNIKGKNLKHSSKKLTQPLKNNKKHLPQKTKVISHHSHNNNNDNHHTRRIISIRDKLSLHSSLDSSIEDNLYTRLLKEDFDEDGGIRKIISLMKPHKSEMDLNFKTKQALELVNNKKNFNFDYNSTKKGNYRNSLNISNESLIKENNNSLIRTPIRKKLSGMTLANTKLTTANTNNKKFSYDKNGNEIVLNKTPIENDSVETYEFYIMENDKGNIIKTQKRVSRKNNGNEIIEYIDENGNVVDINKYTIIDKAIQHVSPKLLDGLFNENNHCDVYEVLDNEGKIIQVRKVFKSTKKNNNSNKESFECNDNVEYIDLNGNVIQVKKVIKQIKPQIIRNNHNSNGGIKNGKELENAINNVKPDFANNNERNNFETPKTKQNYNHNRAKNDLTNSNNAPNTSRNKYISNSISSCFIKPYTSIRDKHSSTGKKSRNKNNEEHIFSEKQKHLFFRNGSLPFLGSYNGTSVTNFISSPEDIIIPSVEHDPKDKFYISSRKAQIIHPPNTMKVSSFGFFK